MCLEECGQFCMGREVASWRHEMVCDKSGVKTEGPM